MTFNIKMMMDRINFMKVLIIIIAVKIVNLQEYLKVEILRIVKNNINLKCMKNLNCAYLEKLYKIK